MLWICSYPGCGWLHSSILDLCLLKAAFENNNGLETELIKSNGIFNLENIIQSACSELFELQVPIV